MFLTRVDPLEAAGEAYRASDSADLLPNRPARYNWDFLRFGALRQIDYPMATVFISYSHGDSECADQICGILDGIPIDYFRDVKDIKWGDNIPDEVRRGLGDCRCVVVIISTGSLESHWVPYEIGYATALGRDVLPFLTHPEAERPGYIQALSYTTDLDAVRRHFTERVDNGKYIEVVAINAPDLKAFGILRQRMPELFAQMKEDLLNESAADLVREFCIFHSKGFAYNSGGIKRFFYCQDEHKMLFNKVNRLEGHGFVDDITDGNTPTYRMTEEFVQLLKSE